MRHLLNVLGGADNALGTLEPKNFAVFKKSFLEPFGIITNPNVRSGCVADNFVVNVGDVFDVIEFVAVLMKKSAKDIYSYERAEISDMPEVIDSGAARVHADGVVTRRLELFNLSRKGIEQME